MIGKEEIHRIRELIGAKEGPVLSLYVDVNPAKPENAGRAYALRAKDAIKALRVPGDLSERVLEVLQNQVLGPGPPSSSPGRTSLRSSLSRWSFPW